MAHAVRSCRNNNGIAKPRIDGSVGTSTVFGIGKMLGGSSDTERVQSLGQKWGSMNPELLQSLLLPVATGTAGTFLGFAVTRWNEQLNERRDIRRAVAHILSEILNARRHYKYSREENQGIAELPQWRRVVQLGKCRFYGNGLGSFEMSALRLFKPKIAEQILDFMLVIRNNDFYIDQAIEHSGPGSEETFNAVFKDLLERFDTTIKQGGELEDSVRRGYGEYAGPKPKAV